MTQIEFKSIIYLEGQVKSLTRDLNQLKQEYSKKDSEIWAKDEIIKSLEKTNERLLSTIEKLSIN